MAEFAVAIPTRDAIQYLVDQDPLVELGAWNGYWAAEIARAGGNIDAYDIDPPRDQSQWYPVEKADEDVLIRDNRHTTLLLCWPPVGSMAYESLLLHDGNVIYIGEQPADGCKVLADMRFSTS